MHVQADFKLALRYADEFTCRARVAHVGTSSVRYEIGLFVAGQDAVAAEGHFGHVFVDRVDRRPTPLPDRLRAALERLQVIGGG